MKSSHPFAFHSSFFTFNYKLVNYHNPNAVYQVLDNFKKTHFINFEIYLLSMNDISNRKVISYYLSKFHPIYRNHFVKNHFIRYEKMEILFRFIMNFKCYLFICFLYFNQLSKSLEM